MKRVLAAFARNTVFANIVLLLIFMAGAFAGTSMLRENFPEFSLDTISVSVLYPGADPEEVEEGISRKVEEAVEAIDGVKQYTTESSEGASRTMIEVKESYRIEEVLDSVRTQVGAISTLPTDAEKPVISEMTLTDSVMVLSLSGDMPERRLKEWARRIRDDLTLLDQISQVTIFGVRDYEIAVEISEERLRQYGISFDQVVQAVRRSSLNLAGGTIRTDEEEIRVRTMGRRYTGGEMASIVVLADPDGQMVTLDRLAEIKDGFSEDPVQARINGRPGVLVNVMKTQEEDALHISRAVQSFVASEAQRLPPGINLEILYDNTTFLQARIDLLLKNGLIGMAIVFLLLWLFLNGRLSFWAGLGIPVSLAGALGVLWAVGGSINMISLFGLIMVLGIVVDDAIVVGESIFVHRKSGKPPVRAAVDGVSEVGLPVIAAVVTSIVAFLPLLFVGGIMGKFIAILPVVVIACLAISLVECLLLLPAHLSHLPDPNAPLTGRNLAVRKLEAVYRGVGSGIEWVVERLYKPVVRTALAWRYISLCLAVAMLLTTVGLLRGGLLKFQVFPEIDGFVITSTVEFPNGTPASVTAEAVESMDEALQRLADRTETKSGQPLVRERLAMVGQTLDERPRTGPHLGTVQAILLESEKRGIHSKELMVRWEQEIGAISGARSLTFSGLQAGPPGAPIEVWLQGRDMEAILAASRDLQTRLDDFQGVSQIRSDFSPGKSEIRLRLKPEARTLGLKAEDLARQVRAGFFGEEAYRLQRGEDDIRVKIRYTAMERSRLGQLEDMRIRTADGREVPLVSVAELTQAPGYATITRTDGLRRVAVSAEVNPARANANEIINELSGGFFQELERHYPGLHVQVQGEKKKMRESLGSLYVGFPLALFGMFIIIATMFRSYIQPLVILCTVPFGMIGAVIGHLLFGYDLSLMSVFGMVALTGVVVNDAIVLIERVNENIAEGMSFFEAVVQGGARRFRPIFLTTLSTVGGLAPLILETDLQARFLIPMGLSIAAGVAFATLLTLLLVPSLLGILNDLRLLLAKLHTGAMPEREAVEPARFRHHDPLGPRPRGDQPGRSCQA
jgi:multidrug efflux pump subunit AcrB